MTSARECLKNLVPWTAIDNLSGSQDDNIVKQGYQFTTRLVNRTDDGSTRLNERVQQGDDLWKQMQDFQSANCGRDKPHNFNTRATGI